MRALGVIAGALLLAGCVGSKERVTLLDPALSANASGSKMGSLIIDPDGTAVLVEMADQQAQMCGENCEPRIKDLGKRIPRFTEIMDFMPREEMRTALIFGEGRSTLSKEQIDYVIALRDRDLELGERPGGQVIVQGFTDSVGQPDANEALAQRRANSVAEQLKQAGFDVSTDDVTGMGEYPALESYGECRTTGAANCLSDGDADPSYRKVEIIIR